MRGIASKKWGVARCVMGLCMVLLMGVVSGQPLMPAPTPDTTGQRPVIVDTKAVTANLHTKSLKPEIGEPATVHVELDKSEDFDTLKVELPEEQQPGVVVERIRHDAKEGWLFDLRFLKAGANQVFGPLEITGVKGKDEKPFHSDSLTFSVPEPKDKQGELKAYTEPLEIPVSAFVRMIQWVIRNKWVLLIVLVTLGLMAWVVRRWLGKRSLGEVLSPPPPPIPPIVEAFQSLEQLEGMSVFGARGSKAHYSALSELLRRYLERQYSVSALEMTEEEVAGFVRRELLFNPATPSIQTVFRNASMAKFAEWKPEEILVKSDLVSSRTFLVAERQRLDSPPPPPPPLAASAPEATP